MFLLLVSVSCFGGRGLFVGGVYLVGVVCCMGGVSLRLCLLLKEAANMTRSKQNMYKSTNESNVPCS